MMLKKLAIMQAYFLPYLGYFQLMNCVDEFILLDNVNFIKRGWINRNQILLDEKAHLFTLPLNNSSQHQLISELTLADPKAHHEKLRRLFHHAYVKAPYYENVAPLLDNIFTQTNNNLSDFIHHSLTLINNYLKINTPLITASTIHKREELTGEKRIVKICKTREAKNYINLCGGINLYKKNNFQKEKINLEFLTMKVQPYRQFENNFVSHLSIIDVMMFNSQDKIQMLLDAYHLN